jgi:superfamily II DNA or RNA helicase
MKIKKIEERNSILISNYQLLSTGVNIKKLHNMVLASPLKAYTTVTQSIGRGMRLHESKKEFVVYDLVDDMGIRTPGGIFYKQYQHRKNTSYNPEEFPVNEIDYPLFNNFS